MALRGQRKLGPESQGDPGDDCKANFSDPLQWALEDNTALFIGFVKRGSHLIMLTKAHQEEEDLKLQKGWGEMVRGLRFFRSFLEKGAEARDRGRQFLSVLGKKDVSQYWPPVPDVVFFTA